MGFLRFILAFAVVVFHTGSVFLGAKIIPGYVCVELFFIISGFYMEFILAGSYKHKRDFYLSRFLRLWPLFAAVAVGYLLFESGFTWLTHKPYTVSQARVYAASNPLLYAGALFSNVFMVGEDLLSLFYVDPSGGIHLFYANFLEGLDKAGYVWGGSLRLNGPAWSIGIEIWFYLLVPFLHRFRTSVLFILLLVSGGLRILLTHFIGVHTYFFFPTQFYLFLTGMVAFRLKDKMQMPDNLARALYFILIAVITGYWYIPVSKEVLRYFVLPLLMFFVINSMFYRSLPVKWDRFIGDLSYPIYILHSFIFLTLTRLSGFIKLPVSETILNYSLYGIVVLFSAAWVWYAEKRLNKFRWKLSNKYA